MTTEDHSAYQADPWVAAWMALVFLQGVRHQGERLLAVPFLDRDLSLLEEHLFVVTAHQAGVWLEAATRRGTLSKKEVKAYLVLRSEIRELRHMREHGDEYLRGKGNRPEDYVRLDEARSIAADASSTIITDEGYELGLRVTVEHVMEAAEEVLSAVQAAKARLVEADESSQ
jgi:hypothetical protein